MYATSVYLVILVEGRGVDQPPLTHMLVRGVRVDILEDTISISSLGWNLCGWTPLLSLIID